MPLPDGSWDTVTQEVGTPLVLSDPKTGQVGIYTTVMQSRETQTFAAIRLKVVGGRITEVEHVLSTRRNLSSPPTPIGDVCKNPRDPDFTRHRAAGRARHARSNSSARPMATSPRCSSTTARSAVRGSRRRPRATRTACSSRRSRRAFKSGRYRFNNRVRDRDCFLVDEERSAVMCRGFIDHKGVLDDVHAHRRHESTRSVFQEPQTWAFLESFKVQERPDHRGGGHLHGRAVLHPLAVHEEAGSGVRRASSRQCKPLQHAQPRRRSGGPAP